MLVIIRGRVKSFFFFFQAEDGIRDIGVTGVQTCALPISRRPGLGSLLHDEVHPAALGHRLVERHRQLLEARLELLENRYGAPVTDPRREETAPGTDDLQEVPRTRPEHLEDVARLVLGQLQGPADLRRGLDKDAGLRGTRTVPLPEDALEAVEERAAPAVVRLLPTHLVEPLQQLALLRGEPRRNHHVDDHLEVSPSPAPEAR